MTTTLTPKQALLLHIERLHTAEPPSRSTLKQMLLWHEQDHRDKHMTHTHRQPGDLTNLNQVVISIAPPKNPGGSAKDRNWVLNIAHMGRGIGYRWEMAGTQAGKPEEAIAEANRRLGWDAHWEPVGWGWQVIDINQKESKS